jgi:hypothetical protein
MTTKKRKKLNKIFLIVGILLLFSFVVPLFYISLNQTPQISETKDISRYTFNSRPGFQGYVQSSICYSLTGHRQSEYMCLLDDVDPIESSCQGNTGCSTFTFTCVCIEK